MGSCECATARPPPCAVLRRKSPRAPAAARARAPTSTQTLTGLWGLSPASAFTVARAPPYFHRLFNGLTDVYMSTSEPAPLDPPRRHATFLLKNATSPSCFFSGLGAAATAGRASAPE